VRANLRGNPRVTDGQALFGHEAAFEAAFGLDPDVVFLVTDGVLDRRTVAGGKVSYPVISYDALLRTVREFRRRSARNVRIHVVGFELDPGDADGLRRLARECGGQVREF